MKNDFRVLIVEDDLRLSQTLVLELSDRGYEVWAAEHAGEVAQALIDHEPTHAVVDLRLKGESGLAILTQIRSGAPNCRVIMLTGYGSVPTAVEAIKLGAAEYLTKPVSTDELEGALFGSAPQKEASAHAHRESLARHEHEYVEYVLARCDGNVSQAARWLGIHRQSLQRKLRKYPPRN